MLPCREDFAVEARWVVEVTGARIVPPNNKNVVKTNRHKKGLEGYRGGCGILRRNRNEVTGGQMGGCRA